MFLDDLDSHRLEANESVSTFEAQLRRSDPDSEMRSPIGIIGSVSRFVAPHAVVPPGDPPTATAAQRAPTPNPPTKQVPTKSLLFSEHSLFLFLYPSH